MATGRKTGGRRVGTPNKRTAEVLARLTALGCDPIEGMAHLAMDKSNSPELRGRMFAELSGYCYPKRRAVEFSDFTPIRPPNELSDHELKSIIARGSDRRDEDGLL